jgi:hypothetical protein
VSGWTGDSEPRAFADRSAALTRFSRLHGTGAGRALATAEPVLTATAPLSRHVAPVRTLATNVLRSDVLERPRHAARSSRRLRALYARIFDTRPYD